MIQYRSIAEIESAALAAGGNDGAKIGRFQIRCCWEGDWFVYEGHRLVVPAASLTAGLDNCAEAIEALIDYMKRRA